MSTGDPVTGYATAVTRGKIVAGALVRLACQRHLDDLEAGHERGLTWDLQAANRAIDFYPHFLKLPGGDLPFTLQPWQAFIVGSLFGWKGADGYRRFRRAYIETGKGSGKTPLLAGIGLYGLTFDDEPEPQVLAAAVTREQAHLLYADAKAMAEAAPDLAAMLDIGKHNIANLPIHGYLRPVSSEGRSLDGKRVHIAMIDEVHEHRNPDVVTKLELGTKGRRQPLIIEITNAGHDRGSICWADHDKSAKVLAGVLEDDAWFAYVCTLDPCAACRAEGFTQPKDECPACDRIEDERIWLKANPNLDVSITRKYLRQQVTEAAQLPIKRDMVLRLNFCFWTTSLMTWIPADRWRTGATEIAEAELLGVPTYAGLDLGETNDFSALALVFFLPDGRVAARMRYWLPESALVAYPDRPYSAWRRAGLLAVTQGNVTDFDQVEAEAAELCLRYGVRELAYDKRFAEQMALHLAGKGITCVDMPQGFQLNEGIRKIETLVKADKFAHGGDPVLAWMVSNVALRRGMRQEVRLDKEKSADKIDGVAALAMALTRAIGQPMGSVYDTGGVLVL